MSIDSTTTTDLASVDLTDLGWWNDGPPYELFARMRKEAPVRWNASADGVGFWSLTRGADITQVSQDAKTFSSARGGIFLSPNALAPLEFARNFSIFKDPPEHSLYRGIVAKAFLPRAMGLIDEVIRTAANRALDKVLANGTTGECDLVRDIAVPVPVIVIGEMLGSPPENMDRLLGWTEEIERGITYGEDVSATFQEMAGYFIGLVNNQLIHGVESLARSISEAEIDGRRLTEEEIAVYFGMLLYAGNEPTRGAIAAGLQALVEHPEQMELVRNHPPLLKPSKSGLPPSALAEILRWTAPIGYFARTATQDVTVGGTAIKAGDRLVMWYPSANRDPDVVHDPDTFDVARDLNDLRHFSYGGGGPHECQGAFLSNKMLSITLQETIKRLGDIELAGEVGRVRSAFANTLTSLPVTFRPATEPRPAEHERQVRAGRPDRAPTPSQAPGPGPTATAPAPRHSASASSKAETGRRPGLLKRLFGGS